LDPSRFPFGRFETATKNQTYAFMDLDTYSALVRENAEEAQAIYWREMLLRIHLACCISLRRHSAWLHSLLVANPSSASAQPIAGS
jgi:hypothetical protein